MSKKSETEKNDKPLASLISIVLAVVFVVGSAGWFFRNLGVIVGPFFEKEDPVPTETPPALGAVEAVLYAECQEQLMDALEGITPPISEQEIAGNEEYLDEARRAVVRLEDLIIRGRSMFDELGRNDDDSAEYREGWNERAGKFRFDLYASVVEVRRLGMSDSFTRLQSEVFLAYHWLDLYSDEINSIFRDPNYDSISDIGLNMSGLHLETASVLLQLVR